MNDSRQARSAKRKRASSSGPNPNWSSLTDDELIELLKPLDGKVFIRDEELRAMGLDMHRSNRCTMVRKGLFPPPVKLGKETNARNRWLSADIRKYVRKLVLSAREV